MSLTLNRRTCLAAAVALGAGQALAAEDEWAPLEVAHGLAIPALVNDLPMPVVLDTGASHAIIDRTLADRLKLRLRGSIPAGGWVNQTTAQQAEPITVKIGATLIEIAPMVVDFNAGELTPPVILGRPAFVARLLDFDFPKRRMSFRPATGFSPPGRLLAIRRGRHGVPLVPFTAEGNEVEAQLDLGAWDAVSVSPDFARKAGLLEGRRLSDWVARDIGGPFTFKVATMREAAFAGSPMRALTFSVIEPWTHEEQAILGLEVIGRFRTVLDMDQDRVWLAPDAAAMAQPFVRERGGLAFEPANGGLRVVHVASHSAAQASGWRVGDQVVSIDGGAPGVRGRLSGPAGAAFTLKLASGEERQVVLADYY